MFGRKPLSGHTRDGRLTVLDLRDTYEIGGPGKTIIETYRALDRDRFAMHLGVFATRHETAETPFVTAAQSAGLPVHSVRGHNQYDPRLIWRIVQLVKTLGVDIIHAHEVKSDVLTAVATLLHRVPIMTTLHGWIGNSRKQRTMIALDRRVARAFDVVVAVSQGMFDEVAADGYRPGQLRLLHNAIVIENYRRTGERGYLEARLGRVFEEPVLSSIGRLSVEKGHADLLEAVAQVTARGHRVSLVLAGDGPARAELEALARALGLGQCVHFTGYIDRPDRLLEETDLAVLPSHTEGLPNAALDRNSTLPKFRRIFRRPSSSTSRKRSSPIIWIFCSSRIFLSTKWTTATSPESSTSKRRRRGC